MYYMVTRTKPLETEHRKPPWRSGRGQIRGLRCAVRTTMVLHAQIIPLRVPRS